MFNIVEDEDGFQTIIEGVPYNVQAEHPEFQTLRDAVDEEDAEKFLKHYSKGQAVSSTFEDTDVSVKDGAVFYGDKQVGGTLVDRILQYVEQDRDPSHMVRFLDNLYDNPSHRAVNELYDFLEHRGLPLTEDGCFLAYKSVQNNYRDKYSGEYDNSVGSIQEMPRNEVDEDRERHCSVGFHVGAWSYAGPDGWYNGRNDRVMLVKVNPRDAVSVPEDHNCTKLRVCRYEVVGEVEEGEPLNDTFEEVYESPSTAQMTGAVKHFANALKKRNHKSPHEVGNELSDIADQHDVVRGDLRDAASKLLLGEDSSERKFCERVVSRGAKQSGGLILNRL